MPEKSPAYRVAIIGGGPAGCATALELMRCGVQDVVIVESGEYNSTRIGESIPPDTRLLLQKLGIREDFLKEGHEICYGSCSSWGNDNLGYNDFLFNPLGNGWHLDRKRFDAFLSAKAVERGTTLLKKTRFERAEETAQGFALTLSCFDGERKILQTIRADFVVDATGHHASFAQSMGAQRIVLDRLICVYGFFELTSASTLSRLTMLEGVEDGWWYAARLPNNKVAAAFASDPEIVKTEGVTTPEEWSRKLNDTRHISAALSGCNYIEGSLKAWPALSFVLDRTAGDRWLAVGDAASAFDPISSQGIHKALAGGIKAGEALFKRICGNEEGLQEYQSAITQGFEHYMANRNYFYALENRWPHSTFWRRRGERREVFG